MTSPEFPEERVVREERWVESDPAPTRRRRTIIERRTTGGPDLGVNPVAAIIVAVLVVFILVLIFGYLL